MGAHAVELTLADGWTRIDQGSQQRFRFDSQRLVMKDGGAFNRSGHLAVLRSIEALVSAGQPQTAASKLRQFRLARDAFPSDESYREFNRTKREAEKALQTPYGAERAVLDQTMTDLRQSLHAAVTKDMAEQVPSALRPFGFDEMRAVAGREYLTLQNRPVLVVDTWDRMSHRGPRRYALILNEGSLLLIYNESGTTAAEAQQVSRLLEGLRFSTSSVDA